MLGQNSGKCSPEQSHWSHVCVATCPLCPLVRWQVLSEGIKKLSTCLSTGLQFPISGVTSSWALPLASARHVDCILWQDQWVDAVKTKHCSVHQLRQMQCSRKFVRVLQILNSLLSAWVYWRFLGDSAFHKKLSPCDVPASIDLARGFNHCAPPSKPSNLKSSELNQWLRVQSPNRFVRVACAPRKECLTPAWSDCTLSEVCGHVQLPPYIRFNHLNMYQLTGRLSVFASLSDFRSPFWQGALRFWLFSSLAIALGPTRGLACPPIHLPIVKTASRYL